MTIVNKTELLRLQLSGNLTEIEPTLNNSEEANQRNLIKCALAVCAVAAIGMLIFSKVDVLSLFQPRVNIEELKLNPWKYDTTPPVIDFTGKVYGPQA